MKAAEGDIHLDKYGSYAHSWHLNANEKSRFGGFPSRKIR